MRLGDNKLPLKGDSIPSELYVRVLSNFTKAHDKLGGSLATFATLFESSGQNTFQLLGESVVTLVHTRGYQLKSSPKAAKFLDTLGNSSCQRIKNLSTLAENIQTTKSSGAVDQGFLESIQKPLL